ncbi:Auxin-induced protein 22D [Morella rubra]|uniref:Auxin-responsive protein n=1 Tax=Morella rubra TaxID=262757 RepID=A0A6A1VCE8_9ROSI|nr:Auxin-induced protein 22D [Morella rubra]
MEKPVNYGGGDLHLEATELRLGLPGSDGHEKQSSASVKNNKRTSTEAMTEESRSKSNSNVSDGRNGNPDGDPPTKAQVVGWPPIRSYRRNSFQPKKTEIDGAGMYVKVSLDGAPYLRKVDLKVYKSYPDLLKALESMFKLTIGQYSEREGYNGSEYAPTYEDKDGDWMLVGDVPWDMFISSCKRLRIMKASEARGLGCL